MWRMQKPMLVLTAVAALAAPAAAAPQDGFAAAWPGLLARAERATVRGDVPEMTAVQTELGALLDAGPTAAEGSLARYTVAYLAWRLAVLPSAFTDDDRDALLDDAVELLRAELELNQENAEAHALLGGLYGLQIGNSAWKGMTLGRRASQALDRARELAPANPRGLLLDGVSKLNTPRMFGGGERKAEALLQRALAAFGTEPPDRPWPRWGRSDVHAWLGQIMLRRGNLAAARRHYAQALEIEPELAWVRHVLLPALEEQERQQ